MSRIFRSRKRTYLPVYIMAISISLAILGWGVCQDGGDSKEVYLLKIDDQYDPIMSGYITRGVKLAEEAKAGLIIIELNTPGGMLHSSWEISSSLLSTQIPTLAWVNKDAASAGGATVISCNNIVVARGGTFGAVVPVIQLIGPPEELGPKYVSYMKKQMGSAAEANGYYPRLAEAMTDKRMEVSYLEYWEWADANKETLQKKGLNVDNIPEKLAFYREMERKNKEEWEKKRTTPASTAPPSVPVYLSFPLDDSSVSEKKKDDDSDIINPRARDWRDDLGDKWFISASGQPLTLTTAEAIDLKVALAEVNSINEIFKLEKYKHLEGAKIVEVKKSWSEKSAKLLIPFSGLLLIFGIIGIATEIKVPGFGAPGILGITCLALFFFVNFGYSMSEWLNIALFILGLVLLAVELFLIPGFGITGITGIILMIIGIFLTLLRKPIPELPVPSVAITAAVIRLVAYLIGGFILILILFRYVLPHTPAYNRIVLTSAENKSEGYHASEGSLLENAEYLVGKTGMSLSTLRPSGKALFDGIRYDVVTDGDMINKDERVVIIEVKGNRIVVKKTQESGKGV